MSTATSPTAQTVADKLRTLYPVLPDSEYGKQQWSNPRPYAPDRCLMSIGEVDVYYETRGYGFLQSAEGRLFFHCSAFRQPRLWDNPAHSPPKPEIQLVALHHKPSEEDRKKNGQQKAGKIAIPPLPKQTALLFEAGKRHGKDQANIWCLRDVYVPLQHELDARYQSELLSWQRAAIYKLVLHRRVYGEYRADNQLKKMVRSETVRDSILFEGTNTSFLQTWFRSCRKDYPLSHDLWLTLHYREWDEQSNQHRDWQTCPDEMMHDFLG